MLFQYEIENKNIFFIKKVPSKSFRYWFIVLFLISSGLISSFAEFKDFCRDIYLLIEIMHGCWNVVQCTYQTFEHDHIYSPVWLVILQTHHAWRKK